MAKSGRICRATRDLVILNENENVNCREERSDNLLCNTALLPKLLLLITPLLRYIFVVNTCRRTALIASSPFTPRHTSPPLCCLSSRRTTFGPSPQHDWQGTGGNFHSIVWNSASVSTSSRNSSVKAEPPPSARHDCFLQTPILYTAWRALWCLWGRIGVRRE